ncbi:MAG: thermonuclease family protein [Solirubrobacteraceae bacterium]|nr:thermonuclease family protein [Solirubrobacteraceae bacterium]
MARGQSTTVKLAGAVVVAIAALVAGFMSVDPTIDERREPNLTEQTGAVLGTVDHIADGDTLTVRTSAGRTERVRLIGIDAPELSTTRTGYAECGGQEARDELERWAPRGTRVRFSTDPTQDERDRFGRLLGYVAPDRVQGGTAEDALQVRLLRAGWARVYVYARSPFEYARSYREIAAEAKRARRGVWAACGGRFDRPIR